MTNESEGRRSLGLAERESPCELAEAVRLGLARCTAAAATLTLSEREADVRVVVGVDGSEQARRALTWACSEAKVQGTSVHVVHVWHYPYGIAPTADSDTREELWASFRRDAEEVLANEVAIARETGAEVSSTLLEGSPASRLVQEAQPDDLLVVGSHGRGGFTGLLLGSVGQQCAHHARCPIVIVPSFPR